MRVFRRTVFNGASIVILRNDRGFHALRSLNSEVLYRFYARGLQDEKEFVIR